MRKANKIPKPRELEIKKRFIERGLTAQEFARIFKVKHPMISMILSGPKKSKDKRIERYICDTLGIDFDVFFNESQGR